MYRRGLWLVGCVLSSAASILAESTVTYTVELGGDNHVAQYEADQNPSFTSGVTDGSKVVATGQDLTWAVRVGVAGVHSNPGGPGDGSVPWGMANMVFNLELWNADSDGNPTTIVSGFGAAPLTCTSGTAGQAGAMGCQPASAGFWSSINDGDGDGLRGASSRDLLANAAFANAISAVNLDWSQIPDASVPAIRHYKLTDKPQGFESSGDPDELSGYTNASPRGGPGFDYGWYPTANNRSGTDIAGVKPVVTTISGLDGRLVGFGAGYKSYFYTNGTAGNGYLPGVAVADVLNPGNPNNPYNFPDAPWPFAFGRRNDSLFDRPLFEGQINTIGMALGTYVLKVVPVAGNNILHASVVWNSATPNYGGFGSFATKANTVVGSQQKFVVDDGCGCDAVVSARKIFYNGSFYDGNNTSIQPIVAGLNNDDLDAVDTSKLPLLPGGGVAKFENWIGCDVGITGLIYDLDNVPSGHTVTVDDFRFSNVGRQGTAMPGVDVVPSDFLAIPPVAPSVTTRCVITFAPNTIKSTWLQVSVLTSAGLASIDSSYWGSAPGDCGDLLLPVFGGNIISNATDWAAVKAHFASPTPRKPVDYAWDINKDGLCNATDVSICRSLFNGPTTCLKAASR